MTDSMGSLMQINCVIQTSRRSMGGCFQKPKKQSTECSGFNMTDSKQDASPLQNSHMQSGIILRLIRMKQQNRPEMEVISNHDQIDTAFDVNKIVETVSKWLPEHDIQGLDSRIYKYDQEPSCQGLKWSQFRTEDLNGVLLAFDHFVHVTDPCTSTRLRQSHSQYLLAELVVAEQFSVLIFDRTKVLIHANNSRSSPAERVKQAQQTAGSPNAIEYVMISDCADSLTVRYFGTSVTMRQTLEDSCHHYSKPIYGQFNAGFFEGLVVYDSHPCDHQTLGRSNPFVSKILALLIGQSMQNNQISAASIFVHVQPHEKTAQDKFTQIETYFELKAAIQSGYIKISEVFHYVYIFKSGGRVLIYIYAYILHLCIKMYLHLRNYGNNGSTLLSTIHSLLNPSNDLVYHEICTLIKFVMMVYMLNPNPSVSQQHLTQIDICCQSLLIRTLRNPQVLIDCIYIEFRVEINQSVCRIRNNPFQHIGRSPHIFMGNKNNTVRSCLNANLVQSIKIQTHEHILELLNAIDSNRISPTDLVRVSEQWEQKVTKKNYPLLAHSQTQKFTNNPNVQVFQEYLIMIRIHQLLPLLCCETTFVEDALSAFRKESHVKASKNGNLNHQFRTQQTVDSEKHQPRTQSTADVMKIQPGGYRQALNRQQAVKLIESKWSSILEVLSGMPVVSGELAATVLTIQSIIKIGLSFNALVKDKLEDVLQQSCYDYLLKAMQIFYRIYCDPMAKYSENILLACRCPMWFILIFQLQNSFRKMTAGKMYIEDNNQFDHLIRCIKSMVQTNEKTGDCRTLAEISQQFVTNQREYISQNMKLKWMMLNLPMNKVSGIFYNTMEIFGNPGNQNKISAFEFSSQNDILSSVNSYRIPAQGTLSADFLLQSPFQSSHCQNLCDQQLSMHSTYSEATFNRIKNRRNIKKFQRFINDQQLRMQKNGLYHWGRGMVAGPLPCLPCKNLEVLKVACGNYHTIIATTIGILGWGEDSHGQLKSSHTSLSDQYTDTFIENGTIRILLLTRISRKESVELGCGNQHSAALINKTLYMWGPQEGGIASGSGREFDRVSCGGLHTLAIKDNKVYSWGRGEGGQLGHKYSELQTRKTEESTEYFLDEPTEIRGIPEITKIACGDAHSILLSAQGQVYVFGFGYQGQLGLGITGDSDIYQVFEPAKLNFPKAARGTSEEHSIKIADIFAGSTFSIFVTQSGQVYSCGLNDCYQLGTGKMMRIFHKKNLPAKNSEKRQRAGELEFSTPKKIQMFTSQLHADTIVCGENHCLATARYLKDSQPIFLGWGSNKHLQISCEFSPDNIAPRTIDNLFDYRFSELGCASDCSVGLIAGNDQENRNQVQLTDMVSQVVQSDKLPSTFE